MDKDKINSFAEELYSEFYNLKNTADHLLRTDLEDAMNRLGFDLDYGKTFEDIYDEAAFNTYELSKIANDISDIHLLGSAIYYRWTYFLYWDNKKPEILESPNRSWFLLALNQLKKLTETKYGLLFTGKPSQVAISSGIIGYGYSPDPTDEVLQELTINADGVVEFNAYLAGSSFANPISYRNQKIKITKKLAKELLNKISNYFKSEFVLETSTDIGTWDMKITNSDGEVFNYINSMDSHLMIDDIDLSTFIRDSLNMQDLFLFNMDYTPNQIDLIELNYSTNVDSEHPYSEKLLIDRDDGIIRYTQCSEPVNPLIISYQMKNQIAYFLNRFNANYYFTQLPEKQTKHDIVGEIRDYTLKITTTNGSIITDGIYSSDGLPNDWSRFVLELNNFLSSLLNGEIFHETSYNRPSHKKTDYIVCSVEFENNYKRYDYLTNDDTIEVGDLVSVPVGNSDVTSTVEVMDIEYLAESELPLPIEKLKYIIEKL